MAVEIGDEAPDFELTDQHLRPVRLSDHRGRKVVALLFFTGAFSPVCVGEMCGVRDRLPAFQNDEVQVLAVSVDGPFALRAFADQEGLDFPLLSDMWPHGEVARRYGCFDDRMGVATRGTFLIDRGGVVRWVAIGSPDTPRDLDEVRAALAEPG